MTEMTGVGQELAAARAARGLEVADVAQQLKFAPRQVEALEQEQFGALPGATFTRGMVRNYARLLKLDPEPLVQRIAGRCEVPDSSRLAVRYQQPVPFSDSARRSTFTYLAVSLGVLVLVGGVAYQWHQERTAARKASVVAKAAKPASPKAEPTPPEAQPMPAETQPPLAPVASAVAAPPAAPAQPVVQEKVITEPKTVVVPAPAPRLVGPHRLVVRTEGEAWIEIKDSADRTLVSSLNPPGSERVVRGRPPYSLVIGNASQVSVTYDDKPVNFARHIRQDVARFTIP
jgi:cytoskeleton protein RodZ